MSTPSLLQVQRQMQACVLRGAEDLLPLLAADAVADAPRRARVYADAYRLRLIEVLGNDFPVLKTLLGDAVFNELAGDYLAQQPSTYFSVRYVGTQFPGWLRSRGGDSHEAELAAFEWAQGEVFDAADGDIVVLGDVASVPPPAWPGLRLQLKPAIRFLSLHGDVPAVVVAHGAAAPLPEPIRHENPTSWLLWRRGFDVYWRALDQDENAALAAAGAGANFGEICESLCAWHADEDVALRAASLLKLWISEELIAALDVDPDVDRNNADREVTS